MDNFFNKTILQKKLPFTHLTRLTVWQLFFVRKGHLFTAVFKIAQWSKIRRKGREKRQGGLHYARQTKKGYNFKNGWNPILFGRCRNDAEIVALKVKKTNLKTLFEMSFCMYTRVSSYRVSSTHFFLIKWSTHRQFFPMSPQKF